MTLIFGETSSGLVVPVKVDANGDLIVSGVDLTTTGGKILVDASGRIITTPTGLYGGGQQRNPIPLGVSNTIGATVSNTNLAAGTNNVDSGAVPAGELWIITNILLLYIGTVGGVGLLAALVQAAMVELFEQAPPVSGVRYDRQGQWVLKPGEKVRLRVTGATAGDDAYLQYVGYSIDVDQ